MPPETEVLKSIDCPTSEGFLLEDMDMDGSLSMDAEADALAVLPSASVIVRLKDAVPVPDGVHVGLDDVVDENDPDAPDSDHLYEYDDVPPLIDAESDIPCPMSADDLDSEIDTDGSGLTLMVVVPDVPL